ncbi:hypothetical protein WBP06_05555 [Novosphingobium sp. BL-8H]|uniref:hypothetical protein n=1 Tax=Novosphingobium sp. BL-8H TaxID=3127640 RepID=UPI0037572579
MKRRAATPALSPIVTLALLAFAMAGCRIIPEGGGTSYSTPASPPAQAIPQRPVEPPPPAPAYTPPSNPVSPAAEPMPAPEPATAPPAPSGPYQGPPLAYTRIGETVFVDGPKVTPLSLIEDSRCPQGVQCIQAGRLKLRVRVDLGSGSHKIDMTLGQPVQIADGALELRDAQPGPVAGKKPAPFAYQFGFRFMGGI